MDHEAAELSRERAASSEPCSTRPNPFDESSSSSRKRQRVSRGKSRSRSADTTRDLDTDSRHMRDGSPNQSSEPPLPHTPTRMPSEGPPAEPTSSRVTINLRTIRPLDSIPSSPPSPSTPSKMVDGGEDAATRESVESESDALSTVPAIETPSSSPSEPGSPRVEIVTIDAGSRNYRTPSPPVAILDGDQVLHDLMSEFPLLGDEPFVDAAKRLKHYMQYDDVLGEDVFCKFRDWMENYLKLAGDSQTFYESYTKYRDFWLVFPHIIWALNYRSKYFGQFLNSRQNGRQALNDIFSQFARLVGKFVEMDVQTLDYYTRKGATDRLPDLGSYEMLRAYSWLLKKEDQGHIGRNLEVHYHWIWDDTVVLMTSSFQSDGGSLPNLTRLVEGQLKLMPQQPKIIEHLTEPCLLAVRIVGDAARVLDQSPHEEWVQNARQQVSQGYGFFEAMSLGLETIIEKHVTFLTHDAAHCYLSTLSSILRTVLLAESDVAQDQLESFRQQHADLPPKLLHKIISIEWRFTILKKLITSAQMQLRVVGVTTMCADLLSLYTHYKDGNDPPRNPILFHFAAFVLEHKLVDYILGIGSHPEIISESYNILGFLIVTRTYPPALTDLIWQTVMNSQDPRVVEAILRMLYKCVNLYDYPSLLHMCQKICDLPIEAFTIPMRELCEVVLRHFAGKGPVEGVHIIDAPPYDLCIRLIRQSSIVTAESPAGHPDIQNFAVIRLRDLLIHGPSMEIRRSIYESCIEDVSLKTPTAPGSICVINTVVRANRENDLHALTTEHGFTQLLVEELEQTIAGETHPALMQSPANLARRDLLLSIMVHEPETISEDLGRRLWDHLVGIQSRSISDRNTSWRILNNAIKNSSGDNAFIAACFRHHLPALPPELFNPGALDFARAYVFSWLKEADNDLLEDQKFESPALQQIWQMILTAPPNTIDAAAIGILVDVYIDSSLITSIPRAKARDIHLALVGRCLKQLAEAASKLKAFGDGTSGSDDDGMVIVPSEGQFQEQERIFARSLAVLREFLKTYQSKTHFSVPRSRFAPPVIANSVEGDVLKVQYQSFDGNAHTEVKTLVLGKMNSPASLFASLQKATGFPHYKVYCGGKEIIPDEVEVCKSLEELNLNGLVLVRRREDTDGPSTNPDGSKITLEAEIVKHFDELWDYLSMHEKVAQEIYYFLVQFPIYDKLLSAFDSETTSYSDIFPPGQPFKSLYAVHALRQHLAGKSHKGVIDQTALLRALSLIVAGISDPSVLRDCPTDELRDCLALHLIECFMQLLREPILPENIATILNDVLLHRLLQLLQESRLSSDSQNSVHLVFRIFEAILETSMWSPEFWQAFVSHLQSNSLLKDLLLENPHLVARKSISKAISSKCSFTPSLSRVSNMKFMVAFWPLVSALIPEAISHPQQCEDTFTLGHTLFKKLAETSISELNLGDLVKQWGSLLLSHECVETVGNVDSMDKVAHGLITLLYCGASFAKASEQELSCSALGTDIFRKHLFPDLHIAAYSTTGNVIVPRIPVLNQSTRHTMSETVFFLVKDDPLQYGAVLDYLERLVSHDERDLDVSGPYSYELPFMFDRSKSIRSQTGYVGLRNLSNTCYLNSLFTQLFMNVSFRDFMLTAPVADGGASQKLLSHTQTLFGHLQNSLMRFVDPSTLAGSIRTYEETAIDVSIQMDVDEFYNLLFDRWESQMLAPDAKKEFRSFYGGQLVQQVKSKECDHISERLEPFSAIQCDIKGKTCLQESLQAYVDGEIMEGENKYKCSTCDRHVDAVKRACLKDIPDNLIFHLKRFDFNLRTLQRSKINDHFSFPDKIDMRPFKVDYLMDSSAETPEDVFELVGVLVHAGTAESGHYYSFIRERPSTSDKDNWVEFNDDTVSSWDPCYMEAACFGGLESRGPIDTGTLPYEKSYSAYMLFYQRSSVVAAQKQALLETKLSSPVRLPLAPVLSSQISKENELLMRKYCLYDPSHVVFVSKMFSNIKKIHGGQCSDDHILEKKAMFVALQHLDQVISRAKELPDWPSFMLVMRGVCNGCVECSSDFLEWFCVYPEGLRHLLVRNPESLVRNDIAQSILAALTKVKSDAPYAYGIQDDENSEDMDDLACPQLLHRIVKSLDRLWDIFHTNSRAWPEYFGLLASIANLGEPEAALLLDAGYLGRTLDMVNADHLLNLTPQLTRMLTIVNKRISTRPVNYEAVISLLLKLLQICHLSENYVHDHARRFDLALTAAPIPLSQSEVVQLTQHWTRSEAHICVEKLLHINQNSQATKQIIIILLKWSEENDVDHHIHKALLHGTRKGVTTFACGPFLKASLVYCEYSEAEPARLRSLIDHIAKAASSVDNSEGRQFLYFFREAMILPSTCANSQVTPEDIKTFCLENVGEWAPSLLTHYDSGVRMDTEQYLVDAIFCDGPDEGPPVSENQEPITLFEATQKLAIACLEYLNDTYIRPRQTVVHPTVISIEEVINRAVPYFDSEAEDPLSEQFFDRRTSYLSAIKKLTVEEADEEVSDWAASEDEYSSEPMGDSIADLCGLPADDL